MQSCQQGADGGEARDADEGGGDREGLGRPPQWFPRVTISRQQSVARQASLRDIDDKRRMGHTQGNGCVVV